MTMRSKQWYTKTSRLANSFAKSSIGRRSSDLVSTTRSSARRPVESKFQICLARYLSSWDHRFFGIADGAIQSFSLGKTSLEGGTRFQIQIPNFSKDLVTTQM